MPSITLKPRQGGQDLEVRAVWAPLHKGHNSRRMAYTARNAGIQASLRNVGGPAIPALDTSEWERDTGDNTDAVKYKIQGLPAKQAF